MNVMKKTITVLMMFFSVFLLPIMAYADDDNPITKIKEKMKFNWKVLDGLDFVFTPIGLFISLITIATLIFVVVRVIIKLVKISTGKGTIKDKWFWIEAGLIVFIVFLFISGAFFSFWKTFITGPPRRISGGRLRSSSLWIITTSCHNGPADD